MTGNVKSFYACGNTARGFANLLESSLQQLEHLYVLKGGPATGKSNVIRVIGDEMTASGQDVCFIHCPRDNASLDGVVIPKLGIGIVNGTLPGEEPSWPESIVHFVDWGEVWDVKGLADQEEEISRLQNTINQAYERAYAGFAEALHIHDDWEAIYIQHMSFQAADELAKEYADTLFGNRRLEKKSRVDHRFLGAATPEGAVDHVPNLTEGVEKRYFVKGRAGSGKSTLLRKLAAVAEERGFDVEIYHCGFDPNSLDMIIVRELGFAIFDSTAPHEYFPDRPADEIVDMYERCITPGTDEAYENALKEIKGQYSAKMKESIGHLAEAKAVQDELEQIYARVTDATIAASIKERLLQEIRGIVAQNV